jgi:hypothetical protein
MKIYVWGTGQKCLELIHSNGIDLESIVGFLETIKCEDSFMGKKLFSLSELEEYDYLLVTIKKNRSIYDLCLEHNIPAEKVCYLCPCAKDENVYKNIEIAQKVMTKIGYMQVCANYGISDDEWIVKDAEIYERLNTHEGFKIDKEKNLYIYGDKFASAGTVDGYFWQDLWAAKKIIQNGTREHYDIGSRLDGFVTHLLAADVHVSLIDIRPLEVRVENLSFVCADATNLENVEDESIESLSALCSLEHFGLGRYGDPIDPDACFKCFHAIQKKVKAGGLIYISVPIGKEHLEFNAHRVFCASSIEKYFDKCELLEFSAAKHEFFEEKININKYDNDESLGGNRYGLFMFRKK